MENNLYQRLKSATPGAEPLILRKQYVVSLDASGADRQVAVTISTASPDREGDTIAVKGWQLDNYLKNPVVLWAHDYQSPPIGRALEVTTGRGKLRSVTEFCERDLYPFADMIYQMVKGGFLSATSVGFRPLKWVIAEDRADDNSWFPPIDFKEQELLEYSWVPVPANPEALVGAKAAGIDVAPLKAWAERTLDEWPADLPLTVADVEAARKALTTRTLHQGVELRTALPFHASPTAPEGETWDGPAEVAAASVDDLKAMCAAYSGDGTNKGDYHLPHHKHDGEHAVVKAGVDAALARLDQTSISDADKASARSHLEKHAAQFAEKGAAASVEKHMDPCTSTTCSCSAGACTCGEECGCVAGMAKALRGLARKSGGNLTADALDRLHKGYAAMTEAAGHMKAVLDSFESDPDANADNINNPADGTDPDGDGDGDASHRATESAVEKSSESDPEITIEQLRAMAAASMAKAMQAVTGRVE